MLTDAGEIVAAFARESLGRAAELERQLDAYRSGSVGRVRVGMIDAANLYLLPEAIRAYRRGHPRVELTVAVDTSGALMQRVAAFELDLAVVVGPPDPALEALTLGEEPLYLYGPDDGDARSEPRAGEAAAAATWALYPPGSRTRRAIDAGLERHHPVARAQLESGNPEILRQHVALGLGWSVLPRDVAEREPGALAAMPPGAGPGVGSGAGANVAQGAAPRDEDRPPPLASREVVVVTRPGVAPRPPVAAFLELAVTEGRARLAERGP